MEQGSLRADVNVSIFPYTAGVNEDNEDITSNNIGENERNKLPYMYSNSRVEIKNLNSIRQVISAVEYEGIRQTKMLLSSTPISIETRTFDPKLKKTVLLRKKEGEVDYRFMPDPNLPPLKLNAKTLNGKTLEEMIQSFEPLLLNADEAKIIQRLIKEYGLSHDVATQLATSEFTQCVSLLYNTVEKIRQEIPTVDQFQVASTVANWICNDFFFLLKTSEQEICSVDSTQFAQLMMLLINKQITTVAGKKILSIIRREPHKYPLEVAEEHGFISCNSSSQERLEKMVEELIMDTQYGKQRNQYKKGGKHIQKIHKFFVGRIMRKSKGIWEPDLVHNVLQTVLERCYS